MKWSTATISGCIVGELLNGIIFCEPNHCAFGIFTVNALSLLMDTLHTKNKEAKFIRSDNKIVRKIELQKNDNIDLLCKSIQVFTPLICLTFKYFTEISDAKTTETSDAKIIMLKKVNFLSYTQAAIVINCIIKIFDESLGQKINIDVPKDIKLIIETHSLPMDFHNYIDEIEISS